MTSERDLDEEATNTMSDQMPQMTCDAEVCLGSGAQPMNVSSQARQ